MGETNSTLKLKLQDAWALADILRHRAPCATDCEYCGEAGGGRPTGYKLAEKVQRAILELDGSKAGAEIRIDKHEAWRVYRYLPSTAYDGARDLLRQVFKAIAEERGSTEAPPWLKDVDLD